MKKIDFMLTAFRDGFQSVYGARVFSKDYLPVVEAARDAGIEFILRHEQYKTSTTGDVIMDDFLKFFFPVRWKYDILRCLDYFQAEAVEYDPRMRDALSIALAGLRRKGFVAAVGQPGKVYPEVKALLDGRKWNTLRALRVEKRYGARL